MQKKLPIHTMEVFLEPEGKICVIPRAKTVLQLLNKLSLLPDSALVIRDGNLLTPDQRLSPFDTITVRIVTSHG